MWLFRLFRGKDKTPEPIVVASEEPLICKEEVAFTNFLQHCNTFSPKKDTLTEFDGFWTAERLLKCDIYIYGSQTPNGFQLSYPTTTEQLYTSNVKNVKVEHIFVGLGVLVNAFFQLIDTDKLTCILLKCSESNRQTTLLKAKLILTVEQQEAFCHAVNRYCIFLADKANSKTGDKK